MFAFAIITVSTTFALCIVYAMSCFFLYHFKLIVLLSMEWFYSPFMGVLNASLILRASWVFSKFDIIWDISAVFWEGRSKILIHLRYQWGLLSIEYYIWCVGIWSKYEIILLRELHIVHIFLCSLSLQILYF